LRQLKTDSKIVEEWFMETRKNRGRLTHGYKPASLSIERLQSDELVLALSQEGRSRVPEIFWSPGNVLSNMEGSVRNLFTQTDRQSIELTDFDLTCRPDAAQHW
jgi:hypothetical protein